MNKYPVYLRNEPKPLVFLVGAVENEPDIHAKIIRVIDANIRDAENKNLPTISFRSINPDYIFPEKKSTKEQLSTEGILKHNWPTKHFDQIPSVVVLVVSFSVDWGQTEWQRREYIIHDKYNRLKAVLSPRDIKLIMLAIRIGAGSIDKDVVDERVSSLKRHIFLDSKTFAFVSPIELNADNVYMKKIGKSVRESSSLYYSTRIKQLKTIQKSITEKHYKGAIESILHARYNFKIAFYFEFQGQAGQSLRYYRLCYESLALSVETVDEELFEQVKTVAEMAHFKICNILLYGTSVIEAFQQFRTHMTRFSKLYSEYPWKHYAWLSDQYVVFTQLLEFYAVNDSLPDADRAYYYHNAARYSQKRQLSFEKMRKEMDLQQRVDSSLIHTADIATRGASPEVYKGMVLMPPRYIGASSQILDPVLDQLQNGSEEGQRLISEHAMEQEYTINHGAVIMGLLNLALEKTNPNFKRRKGFLLSLIAEQNIKDEHYTLAMKNLCTASELLTSEGWVAPSVAILGLIMKCAILLGRPVEFLNAALTLYANASALFLSRYEIEELHLNVMSLLEASLANRENGCVVKPSIPDDCFLYRKFRVWNKTSFLTSSFISLVDRPEYGSVISEGDHPVEYCLNGSHCVIDMSLTKKMFDIQVSVSSSSVELGQKLSVRLTIASRFMDEIAVDEMKIFFTDNSIIKHFITTSGEAGDYSEIVHETVDDNRSSSTGYSTIASEDAVSKSNKDIIRTPLIFPPGRAMHFEFYLYISESGFGSFLSPDAVLCLERIELIFNSSCSEVEGVAGTSSPLDKQLTFDISACPDSVLKARKSAGKPLSLKDVLKYCFNDNYPTITIQKPSALLSMIKPSTDSTTLLQGVIQRVNVLLKVGECDMLDGYVYLVSDYTPASNEAALFWYPDRTELERTLNDSVDVSDEDLDLVPFHALRLSETTMQPCEAISLGRANAANSILFLPLFVMSPISGVITVKLRVEYVPRGRLNSSLVKEFVLRLNFVTPLTVAYRVSSHGVTHDNHTTTLFANEDSLLTTTVNCLQSMSYAIGLSDLTLELSPNAEKVVAHQLSHQERADADKSVVPHNQCNLLSTSTTNKPVSHSFPICLRNGECYEESMHFRCSPHTADASIVSKSVGRLRAKWRVLKKHPLRHTIGTAQQKNNTVSLPKTHWLLPLGHKITPDETTTKMEPLDFMTLAYALSVTYYEVPEIRIASPPFIVALDAPTVSNFGQIVSLRVTITSNISTSERLRLIVVVGDNFVQRGDTVSVIEVPGNTVLSTNVLVLPLRCGALLLPHVSLQWERPSSQPVKILDTGCEDDNNRDGNGSTTNRQFLFVHPLPIAC